ncbi:MAG: 30S ribosomal protein S17 [bacterium]|nr:30S ribosomal protein S17 [bacterium]
MTKTTSPTQTANKVLTGTVVSTKMAKTVVVAVNSYTKHPKYGKYLRRTKRYQAHEESGALKVGDKVKIKETRPISKHKHFMVVK